MADSRPHILVWSSLFPSPAQPQAGIFIRERMFRVAQDLPLTVISPQPWFPLQSLIRKFKPHFRPETPRHERQSGIDVFRPRYLSVPGVFKHLDGWSMAAGARNTVRHLQRQGRVDLIDAHFAYPDGYAASRVAGELGVPLTLTLRGTEVRHTRDTRLRKRVVSALHHACKVFTVSSSLRELALELGMPAERTLVVGNGVEARRYLPLPQQQARRALGLPADARVLITVGGLVERKGYHRVIACLPELRAQFPKLHYLAVGCAGPEGDFTPQLEHQVQRLGLQDHVHFTGALPTEGVRQALSASDVFVLASRNEGWANVLLEAMACGLPVVASDVGGNAEVVCRPEVGSIVPFDDHAALVRALRRALTQAWDRAAIRQYAEENDWQARVRVLVSELRRVAGMGRPVAAETFDAS
jgi:glycosyltransferase involved in cell wall biosynthesis